MNNITTLHATKRMRTISAAIKELRAADPGTSITPYALRRAVLSGQIPCVMTGRKKLIDMDNIQRYLCEFETHGVMIADE